MENKYCILWLDDQPIKDFEQSLKYPFEIKKVDFVDECETELCTHADRYQAVILDANGLYSTEAAEDPSKTGFLSLVEMARDRGLPVYIYTGTITRKGDGKDYLCYLENKGYSENHTIFNKNDGISNLLDHIIEDLENDYSVFQKYPEIHEDITMFDLNTDQDIIRDLLLWKEDHSNNPFPEYSKLRHVVVDVIINRLLKNAFQISSNPKRDKVKTECMSEWEKSLVFNIFKPAANDGVHGREHDEEYLYPILANSFILILEWYNRFRKKMQKDSNPHDYYEDSPNPIIESENSPKEKVSGRDVFTKTTEKIMCGTVTTDENGFYKVGDFLIKNHDGERLLGKKVEVVKKGYFQSDIAWKVSVVRDEKKPTFGDSPEFAKLKNLIK